MTERYALIYTKSDLVRCLDEIRLLFEEKGIELRDPTTGTVFRLDDEGEQVPTDIPLLQRLLRRNDAVRLQWWLAPENDVYARLRRVDSISALEFGMEGCVPKERDRITKALFEFFEAEAAYGRAVGLVFDPEGLAEDFDWDCFFLGNIHVDFNDGFLRVPKAIAISKHNFSRIAGLPAGIHIEPKGDFLLITSNA